MVSYKKTFIDKYNSNTNELVKASEKYNIPTLPTIVHKLRNTMRYESTYIKVFGADYRDCYGLNRTPALMPSADYCMAVSYYIYLKTGQSKEWEIMGIPSHWWLLHTATGLVLDITADQLDKKMDYSTGSAKPVFGYEKEQLYAQAMTLARAAGLER